MTISKTLFILLALGFTVPATLMHGKLSNRWDSVDHFEKHVKHLKAFPENIDTWKVVEKLAPLKERVQKELGIKMHINRVYEDPSGNRVTALIMVGPAGPLVRHPVEVCYNLRTKQLIHAEDIEFENDLGLQRLRVRRYEPNSMIEDEFLVTYGFCVDGKFDAPESPRMKYGAEPVIYKIQILSNADGAAPTEIPPHVINFAKSCAQFVWPKN